MNLPILKTGRIQWLVAIVLTGIAISLLAIPLSAIAIDDAEAVSNRKQLLAPTKQGSSRVAVAPVGSFAAPELNQSYRGVIRARRESSLSIRRAGQLLQVLVHEGDRVRNGDTLAFLDTSDLDVRERMADAEVASASAAATEAVAGPRYQTLKSAAASVRQLQAQWESAKSRFDRQQRLSGRNAGSDQEYDDAKYAAAELKARLDSATAELEELNEGTRTEQIEAAKANRAAAIAARQQVDVDRRDSRIVAPYDGVIAERFVDEGEMLTAGKPVLRIMEVAPLEAHFGVPVDTTLAWTAGDRFEVRVGKHEFYGKIVRMQPQVDTLTRTRAVQLELLPKEENAAIAQATVGQTATLLVPITQGEAQSGKRNQFWLPTEALVRGSRGLWSVYVAVSPSETSAPTSTIATLGNFDGGSVIQRREVRIIRASNQLSLVDGMIRKGELVVIDGAHRVGPGVGVETVLAVNSGGSAVGDDSAPSTIAVQQER